MPYINNEDRIKYNNIVDKLGVILNDNKNNDILSCELNYVLFRLAAILCNVPHGGQTKYARMAVVLSAMSEASIEFRRRVLAPYEDEKIQSKGDIDLSID